MSSTKVPAEVVRASCLNFVKIKTERAEKELEEYIEETRVSLKSWWKGEATKEQAIKALESASGYNMYYRFLRSRAEYYQEHVEPILALCNLSFDGFICLTSEDAQLVNNWR